MLAFRLIPLHKEKEILSEIRIITRKGKQPLKIHEPITLWKTIVGSHMWKMNRPDSDKDYYNAVLGDSKHILLGDNYDRSKQVINGETDETTFEVGKTIRELLKGNVNHIWGVTSPVIEIDSKELQDLKKLYGQNICKNCFHSIRGLAKHNITHFLEQKREIDDNPRLFEKKLNTIARSLKFGINILDGKGLQYEPTSYLIKDKEIIYTLLKELETAYENSSLPEEPDPDPFFNWLLKLRLRDLK
jgi:predicted nucleotidyltransferase